MPFHSGSTRSRPANPGAPGRAALGGTFPPLPEVPKKPFGTQETPMRTMKFFYPGVLVLSLGAACGSSNDSSTPASSATTNLSSAGHIFGSLCRDDARNSRRKPALGTSDGRLPKLERS